MISQYVTVKGYIRDGELRINLPENVADGEIEFTVTIIPEVEDSVDLETMFQFEGKKLGAIETGGWEDLNISDSTAWVEQLRRKSEERCQW